MSGQINTTAYLKCNIYNIKTLLNPNVGSQQCFAFYIKNNLETTSIITRKIALIIVNKRKYFFVLSG